MLEESTVNNENDEDNEIFGNIENNIPPKQTLLSPDENNMDNMATNSSTKSLKKFMEFLSKYQPVKELNPNIVSEIKRVFKKSDGTAFTDKQFQSFCDKHDKGNGISINADDLKFVKFIAVFKEMKQYYISSCNELLDMLEERILALHKENPDNAEDEGEFKIKNIKYDDLFSIEHDVRMKIGELYVKCNQYYYLGVNELYKGLTGMKEEQKQ